MLAVTCPNCSTRYRVPETARGKRITCKKCGKPFRIAGAAPQAESRKPQPVPPGADSQFGLSDLEALATGEVVETWSASSAGHPPRTSAAIGAATVPLPYVATPPGYDGVEEGEGSGGYLRYLASFGQSFAFIRSSDSLATFAVIWFLLALRELMMTAFALMPCFFFAICALGILAVTGWYMAFQMNVVAWAAGNETNLPPPVSDTSWWDGVFVPAFRMCATYMLASWPAMFFMIVLGARVGAASASAGAPAQGTPTPGPSAVAVLVLLMLLGGFMWPMMVLVVSCGGSVGALFRLDLIFETVFKSFPAYLLTVVAVYVAFGVRYFVSQAVGSAVGSNATLQDDWAVMVVVPALFVGVAAYFDVIAMQAIGYYYRDFKDRFAWSWG